MIYINVSTVLYMIKKIMCCLMHLNNLLGVYINFVLIRSSFRVLKLKLFKIKLFNAYLKEDYFLIISCTFYTNFLLNSENSRSSNLSGRTFTFEINIKVIYDLSIAFLFS